MEATSVDPILEPDREKRTGNPLAEVPNKKLKRSSHGDHTSHYSSKLKHNLPGVLANQKQNVNSNTNSVENKLDVPHKIPDCALLIPNPDCFFLEREGEPLLSIPLNGEGDKIVNKLFDKAIEEHLSFKFGEFGLREKYKWIDRWSLLRYKQHGTTPSLSKWDAQSLDEILNCESDSNHELLPNSKSTTNLPNLRDEVYQPDLSYTDPPLPSTPDVPEESPQENIFPIVRPCITFYNALPEDFNSEVSKQSELIRSVKTSTNDCSSRSFVKNGNEVIKDHVPAVNTSLISTKGTSDAEKRPRKTVSWSPKLAVFKESESDDHVSLRRRARKNDDAKLFKTNRRRFCEGLFDSFDQNFGDVGVDKHYRHLSERDHYKHRSCDQCGFSRDGDAHELRTLNSSNDHSCYTRALQTSWRDLSHSDASDEDSCPDDYDHCQSFADHGSDHWYDPPY